MSVFFFLLEVRSVQTQIKSAWTHPAHWSVIIMTKMVVRVRTLSSNHFEVSKDKSTDAWLLWKQTSSNKEESLHVSQWAWSLPHELRRSSDPPLIQISVLSYSPICMLRNSPIQIWIFAGTNFKAPYFKSVFFF